ncbi:MAG: hypothetical protein IJW25_03455, partial [Clostridia bacterium]|nr:hypothetical protein [Clostridia bacterium]
VDSSAQATLSNSFAINNCYAEKGAALYVVGGSVEINGTEFNSNKAGLGGAIYVDGATISVVEAKFLNNKAEEISTFAGNGGAIYVTNNSVLNITSVDYKVEFNGNNAQNDGGAIYFESTSQQPSSILGALLTGNISKNNGGAIYKSGDATLVVGDKTKLTLNEAISGGAIYASNGLLTIYDAIIGENGNGNKADNGGAISVEDFAVVDISSSSFESNTAAQKGGAIYANSKSTNTSIITGATVVSNNYAGEAGGGVYLNKGVLEISGQGTTLSNNTGSRFGGAIYAKGTLTVRDASVLGGRSSSGSAIYLNNSQATLIKAQITGCENTVDNGAIYVSKSTLQVKDGTIIADTKTKNALYIDAESVVKFTGAHNLENNIRDNIGGVYVNSVDVDFNMEYTYVRTNKNYGLKIVSNDYDDNLVIGQGCNISSNEQVGIYYVGNNDNANNMLQILNCDLQNNKNGAIYVENGNILLQGANTTLNKIGEKFPEGFIYEDLPFFFGTYLPAKRAQIIWEKLYFYRVRAKNSTMQQVNKKVLDRLPMVSLTYEKMKNTKYLLDIK